MERGKYPHWGRSPPQHHFVTWVCKWYGDNSLVEQHPSYHLENTVSSKSYSALNMRCEPKNCYVWDSIILGFPWLWLCIVPSKVTPFGVYMQDNTTCDIVWISQYPQIIIPLPLFPSSLPVMTKERTFHFGLILQALIHRKSTENRQGTNFAAICLMFKSSVTVHHHAMFNMPRIMQSSLVINGLSSWMILSQFFHVYQSKLMLVDLRLFIP